jgi:parallel beta-helix repeat protein
MEGIVVRSSRNLSNVMIDGNTLSANDFGVVLDATERGNSLYVVNNRITGNNGTGVGLDLMANNAMVEGNVIRGNRVGVLVEKVSNNQIMGNNIVGNDGFGVRIVGAAQGQEVDAYDNWWGEPSGPKSDKNPNGLGNRAGDGVMYEPFLKEPAITTLADFQISNVSVPESGRAGQAVEISFNVKNTGPEEGTQVVTISVSNSQNVQVSNMINTRTLNPSAETDVSMPLTFTFGGTYLITISTYNDSVERTIDVNGPLPGKMVETALDVNGNRIIDDSEIMFAVNSWVTQKPMTVGDDLTIDDDTMKRLIVLWATGEQYSLGVQQAPQTETEQNNSAPWWKKVLDWFGVK